MTAEIKTIDPIRVLAVRHTGPYNEIGGAFDHLFQAIGPLGLPIENTIGIYLDNPKNVPAGDLRSDACAVLSGAAQSPAEEELPEGVNLVTIPGGTYAVARHTGSYSGLPGAWDHFVSQAIPALGRELAPGPCFEWYLNDCTEVPEADLITDLYTAVEG